MESVDYLRALRRRWPVVVASALLAMTVAWVTTTVVPAGPAPRVYEARTVLLRTRGLEQGGTNLTAVAALTGVGEVPVRVAERLGEGKTAQQRVSQIEATANSETGFLTIKATAPTPQEAEAVADVFAQELLEYLQERKEASSAATADRVGAQMDQLQKEIARLDAKIPKASRTQARLMTSQRDAKVRQFGFLYEQYQNARGGGSGPDLQVIQDAVAQPTEDAGFHPPRSRTSRAALAGILGLLAGIALALVLDRFDNRIRTKQSAETHFKQPVLAEIPWVPRRKRKELNVGKERSKSFAVDAFRLLAAGMSHPAVGGNGHARLAPAGTDGPGQTILVTSPGPAEGKSTVVANLAATFAEFGRSVVVLSCDFRRPRLHRLFGVPNDRGLTKALASGSSDGVLRGHVRKTEIANVRVVPSGPPVDRPGELLASPAMQKVLEEARAAADIVLLDTAPILVASDATHLLDSVDVVLVVSRARRTNSVVAARTAELLERFNAPVVGVVLNAAREAPMPRRYYYYYRPRRFGGENGVRVFPRFRGTRKKGKV